MRRTTRNLLRIKGFRLLAHITLLICAANPLTLASSKSCGSAFTANRGFELVRNLPFGVPAALATWIIVAIEWSGYGLEWPPFK